MEFIWWIVIIGGIAFFVWRANQSMRQNNEELGASATETHRVINLNYLGGFEQAPAAANPVNLIVTPRDVAVEKGSKLLARIPMSDVHDVLVETEEEAKRRLTATRLLTIGVFALAFPKKTKGSVLITVNTTRGPVVFERTKASKPDILRQLGPALAMIQANGRGPVPVVADSQVLPPGNVADELTKLAELLNSGLITQTEFDQQKRRLFGQ